MAWSNQGENGGSGENGKSAYEIWLDLGNVGSEQDFIDSLVGPEGPMGPPGSGNGSTPVSKWQGKIWNALGDSITFGAGATTTYHKIIKDKIGCTVNNYGIGGTGWFKEFVGQAGAVAFYNRVDAMNANADLITVFGGTNDWNGTLTLGSFGDTDGATSFYGAVDSTLTQLLAKYPTKTIAVFTPIPRSNNWATNTSGVTLEQVTDAIIKVCKKYSIPVLDLYRNSNMHPWNADSKSALMPDGLHPNNAGQARMADKILAFINTL